MGSGVAIKAAYEKYGINNFHKDIIMFCTDANDLNYWEELLVDKYWVERKDTYNLTVGGSGRHGHMSIESRTKMSKTRKERIASGEIIPNHIIMTDASKAAISIKAKERLSDPTKHPMYNKKHSEESKHLMSIHHSGGWKVGSKFTEQHIKNIKLGAQNRKNKFSKEELIEKYSVNNGKHWWNNGQKNVFSKECLEGYVKGRI